MDAGLTVSLVLGAAVTQLIILILNPTFRKTDISLSGMTR